jgi:hypothetical protein
MIILFLFNYFITEGKEKIRAVNFYENDKLIKRIEGEFYGYKKDEKENIYLIGENEILILNKEGKQSGKIRAKGNLEISRSGKYQIVYDDKRIKIYKNLLFFSEIPLKEKSLRKILFSPDEKYLALLFKNSFLFFSLEDKIFLFKKDFDLPLIFGKIFDTLIVLVSEERDKFYFETYLFDYSGNLLKKFINYYQRPDELVLDVEIERDKILAKTYLDSYQIDNPLKNSFKEFFFNKFLADTIPWPLPPTDSLQPLGNNWGEYQNYGGSPYFHPGIDILTPQRQGVPVYAVKDGWVKAWLTIQARYHWRLAIADSSLEYPDSCEGFLYAHIDSARYHKQVGDYVQKGELIGYLVPWPVSGFDHIHFAKIKDEGYTWPRADWAFIFNPLILLRPNIDTIPPKFEYARPNQYFAFCLNNTSNYLNPDSLYGDVDIICKVYDKFSVSTRDTVWDRLIPLKIEYEIIGEYETLEKTLSFSFSGRLPSDQLINVVYKQDNICRSRGDYNYRDYYFIITNTDGDSLIESSDINYCWPTRNFPNGRYLIKVYAHDAFNNCSVCSMFVRVANPSGISEKDKGKIIKDKKEIYSINGQKIKIMKKGVYFIFEEKRYKKVCKYK